MFDAADEGRLEDCALVFVRHVFEAFMTPLQELQDGRVCLQRNPHALATDYSIREQGAHNPGSESSCMGIAPATRT